MPTTLQLSPNWSAVFSNKTLLGYVLDRGPRSGFEALDIADRSLGRFDNLQSAADAVFKHEQ